MLRESEASGAFGCKFIDARRGAPRRNAAAVDAELSVAEVIGEDEDDVRFDDCGSLCRHNDCLVMIEATIAANLKTFMMPYLRLGDSST
jgi:hypothetical protein